MSKRKRKTVCDAVVLRNEGGEELLIRMRDEAGERLGVLWVDDVPYHVFFARREELGAGGEAFIVDRDPSYRPRLNAEGQCVLIAPYSC